MRRLRPLLAAAALSTGCASFVPAPLLDLAPRRDVGRVRLHTPQRQSVELEDASFVEGRLVGRPAHEVRLEPGLEPRADGRLAIDRGALPSVVEIEGNRALRTGLGVAGAVVLTTAAVAAATFFAVISTIEVVYAGGP